MKTYCSLIAAFILSLFQSAQGEEILRELGPTTSDGWFSSYYNKYQGVNDYRLQAGGWGDSYRFLIRFNLTDLPKKADRAILWLYCFDRKDSSTTVPMNIWRITSSWNEYTGWYGMPSALRLGYFSKPTENSWYGMDITTWYNDWQNGTYYNWGFMFGPRAIDNKFNNFYSSDYSNSQFRPKLQVMYNSGNEFKMPLPGGKTWLLTTEISGTDCGSTEIDQNHTENNYYSLDFSSRTLENNGNQEVNVPILAAAKGKVVTVDYNQYNGNYVVIDHDGDGSVTTGFTTRYLHMATFPYVKAGDTIERGTILGIMGNTGESHGVHLHFGIRFNNNGSSGVPELQKLKLDGLLLNEYQTYCDGGVRNSDSYYYSTNQQK